MPVQIVYRPSTIDSLNSWLADMQAITEIVKLIYSSIESLLRVYQHQNVLLQSLNGIADTFTDITSQGTVASANQLQDLLARIQDIVPINNGIGLDVNGSKELSERAALLLHDFIMSKRPA